ncbi:hypothetical protein CCS79_03040 [Clostridium diolis]|uniref:hypothetical protein n=1 Tax=Clostridium diolis TaxID=223919 RepID=UPI000B3FFDBF|nr:hypothetical protein [Clostridium diolis]OVE70001.1 hypothetical protein CCS79_03040 [Clostridium diolis]
MKDLFKDLGSKKKICKSFKEIRDYISDFPSKKMMNEVFNTFGNSDKDFVEQFQTHGFDARCFELYLHAVFQELGFKELKTKDNPDFLLEKDEVQIAIEATTCNPSMPNHELISNGSIEEKLENEYPIKWFSCIERKVKKKYSESEQCKDKPLVIALEDFHERTSLQYPFISLFNYLYGVKYDVDNGSVIKIDKHIKRNGSTIESGLFHQEEARDVSAILFSNSGTTAKFKRMGYYKGYYFGNLKLIRKGLQRDNTGNKLYSPERFCYNLDFCKSENWTDDIVLFINPNARIQLPVNLFGDIAKVSFKNNELKYKFPSKFIYSSFTRAFFRIPEHQPKNIDGIMKKARESLKKSCRSLDNIEKEWYLSRDNKLMGIIVHNIEHNLYKTEIFGVNGLSYTYKSEKEYSTIQLARDELFSIVGFDIINNNL